MDTPSRTESSRLFALMRRQIDDRRRGAAEYRRLTDKTQTLIRGSLDLLRRSSEGRRDG